MKSRNQRLDHQVILDWIKPGATVLDLGCGEGELLDLLVKEKGAIAQGIEISEQAIYQCVARGLSVFHEDIDRGLSGYGDRSFDYIILNQSLQQVRNLDTVMKDSLRIGRKVIIGFPNFAHYGARCQLFFQGKAPVTAALPFEWHDTPNLHFLSIWDFMTYCRKRKIAIDQSACLTGSGAVKVLPNLFARTGLFLISNGRP
jgi:methionine biosynthesis protein MetW